MPPLKIILSEKQTLKDGNVWRKRTDYESEIAEHPFPRSSTAIEALATLRGSECGVNHAEAFMLLKEIEK